MILVYDYNAKCSYFLDWIYWINRISEIKGKRIVNIICFTS